MAQLAEEGLVRRDPGRGTFVAEPPTHRRANFLMTFSHEMRRQGRVPSSRIVERRVRPPTDAERTELRVARDAEVVDLRRVRLADGQPMALERAVLTTRCIEVVLAADLESGSLHEALIRAGMVPSRGKSSIRAEAANADDAVLLGVRVGDPMLVERRLIFDHRGRPIERTESRYAADRYGLNVGFSVEDSGAVTISPGA
jgi:GntR family transcriptional regulator